MEGVELHLRCQGFLGLVLDRFGYLLNEYGFEVIHKESVRLGERCMVVLASPDCRIRFIFDRGGVEVDMGGVDAPATWGPGGRDRRQWFAIHAVSYFLHGGKRPTTEQARALGKEFDSMTTEEIVSSLADYFRPFAREAFALFRKDAPPERRRAFEVFVSG